VVLIYESHVLENLGFVKFTPIQQR